MKKNKVMQRQSPPPTGRPLPTYSLSRTLPKTASPTFCFQDEVVQHGKALDSSGHLPGCIPSQILVHTQSTRWGQVGQGGQSQKVLPLCKHCTATVKMRIFVNTFLVINLKRSTIQAALRNNLTPSSHTWLYSEVLLSSLAISVK